MGVRFLPDRKRFPRGPVSGAPATDADVALWVAAVVANAGTVSAGRVAVVTTFVQAEKAAGAWARTDDYWALWAENVPQALTSLKQRRLAVPVSAPNFTSDRDYTFNGTTNYIDTGFTPSLHFVAMLGTDQRLAVYERTNVSGTGYALGTFSSSSRQLYMRTRNGALMQPSLNSSTAVSFTLPVADSRGYTATSRAAAGTTVRGFKNGAAMTDVTGATVGTGQPSLSVYIAASNPLSGPRAASVGFACLGASLSDAQELAQYNNVQAWATAVGANV